MLNINQTALVARRKVTSVGASVRIVNYNFASTIGVAISNIHFEQD
jgi:hypothetical protein